MARRKSLLPAQSALAPFSILLVLLLVANVGESSTVKITNNGYSGIVVAFSPRISQAVGEPLIAQIQELFKSASVALYHATRQRSYFRNVTILVPQEWETKNYETAGSEAFGEADIRIDEPNAEYGDGPYTLQPLGCGSEGLFIHLTPGYLQNLKTTSTDYFGDPGKTLVHEWAHLRYGIFDEFGYAANPMFPMAYYDDGNMVPNSCTNGEVDGIWKDVVKDGACEYNEGTGMPNDDCVFLPNKDKNGGIQSSLASYHFLKDVFTFCDDGEVYYHNALPQNKHNVLCESQSTWGVIQQHEDFKGNKNLPNTNISEVLEPTFRIVQETVATYSLVLDVSGSMEIVDASGTKRITILHDTVKRWLQEEVHLGSAVGIITFSSTLAVPFPVQKITDETTRKNIIAQIPTKGEGGTHIGSALQTSIAELKKFRNGPGGIIILITDGEENGSPYIKDVLLDLQNSQARLVAIALHTQASTSMETAVKVTDGKMFSIPNGAGAELLGMAFYEALTYQTRDFQLAQKIYAQSFVERGTNFVGNFAIDKTIGNDTTIDFATKDAILDVTIRGPELNDDIRNATVDPGSLVRFKYPSLTEGIYYYNITRKPTSASARIQVSVTSKARSENVPPIITRSWIQQEAKSTADMPRFVILAEVKQGNNPVINAAVMAKVDRPNKGSIMLQLFDNGNGAPDVTRNDGIYARYFTRFGGKGRYGVSAQVTDDGKASIREVGFTGSRSMPITNKFQTSPKVSYEPTGSFSRESSGGAFNVEKDLNEDVDLFPPSRVSDLHVTFVSEDNSKVIFSWTAPGDDYDYGNASRYEFRYSSDFKRLKQNFTQSDVLNMDLTPQPAGESESLTVSLPDLKPKGTIYVAMVAVDKSNQTSSLSNVAVVSGSAPIQDSNLVVIIVGAVLAGLVVIVAIVAAVMFHRKRKANAGS